MRQLIYGEIIVAFTDRQHPRGANCYHKKLLFGIFYKMLTAVLLALKVVINTLILLAVFWDPI